MNDSKPPLVYLAGPFFNAPQKDLIQVITNLLEEIGYRVYSPSRDGGMISPSAGKEDRKKVFKDNIDNISSADLVVSVYDYLMPENTTLGVLKDTPEGTVTLAKGLNFPDTGTTFEDGVCYMAEVPLIMFRSAPERTKKVNLMLTEAAWGFCDGLPLLRKALTEVYECYSKHFFEKENPAQVDFEADVKEILSKYAFEGRVT
jgi:nucleoside 2-deoxyribosyltransferase